MEISRFLVQSGGPVLVLAALLLVADGILLAMGYAKKVQVYRNLVLAVILAWGLVVLSYSILLLAFVADAFWVGEVFSYSSSGLPLLFKLGNPWIGGNGSLLFITLLLAIVYGVYRLGGSADTGKFRTTAYVILDGITVFFILVTLMQSPFALLETTPPEGMGLNPLLQTPWVLIHPPVIFLGYVFVFFAFALMLARKIAGREGRGNTRQYLTLPLSAAWLMLTLGIALGALWSYRVLGWGGYWAWDPVETASLLPWLAVTAYFHLSPRDEDRGPEYMLASAFFMVLFATALTRGGFAQSVHAFGESPAGFVFLGFAIACILLFLFVIRRQNVPLSLTVDMKSTAAISRSAAVWSLVALLAVCFAGTAGPGVVGMVTGKPLSIGPGFFTLLCYPFTLAFVAALIGCNSKMTMKQYALLIAVMISAGAVLAFLRFPTPVPLADFGLPLLAVAGLVIAYQALQALCTGGFPTRFWGKWLVHFAIVLILLGVFISSAAQAESRPLLAAPGSEIEALGSSITVENFSLSPAAGTIYFSSHDIVAPEYAALSADVVIREGGATRHGTLRIAEYLNYGVVSDPLVLSGPEKDVYLSMHQTNSSYSALVQAMRGGEENPGDVTIIVKYVPLIWLLWLGILVLVSGMGILFIQELWNRAPLS